MAGLNRQRARASVWIAGAGALIVLAAVVVRLLPDTAPDSDFAVIDLDVFRVLHGWQAVGPYSRFGWSHPGPLYFQLLAPLYLLSGYRHLAVVLTVAAMNVASLFGLLTLLRRHSPAMLVAAVPWFAVYLVRLDGLVASPWNPYVPLLPFALLIVAAAASAAGAFRLLPLVVGLACFVVQTHLGFAAPAIAVLGATAGIIAVRIWRALRSGAGIDRSLVRQTAIAAFVGACLWMVPAIDEIRPAGQHNLQAIATNLGDATPHDPRLSSRAFERMVVAPLTPHLQLWGNTPLASSEPGVRWAARFLAAAIVAAAIVFFARRRRFESSLAFILIAASLAGLAAARRLPEAPQEHTLIWATVLGLMAWTVVSAIPVTAIFDRVAGADAVRRLVAARWLTTAIVVAVLAACVRDVVALRAQDVRASARIERLTAIVREKADRANTREPFIRVPGDFWGVSTGVVLQLRRAGLDPHVDADWIAMFGPDCAPTGREPVTIAFARPEEHDEDFRYRSNYERLGEVEDIRVYAVDPPPPTVVAPAPLRVTDHSAHVSDPDRVSDGALVDPAGGRSVAQSVPFSTDEEFVTLEVPPVAIVGVRVWGEPGSAWQLRCAGASGPAFERIGQVRIEDGGGTRAGESFLWSLEGCRQLKIAPVAGHQHWLNEVQLLMTPAR